MSFWRRKETQCFFLLLPYMLLFLLFILIPLAQTVIGSFTGGENLFANYRMLFTDSRIRQSLMHTLGYALISAVLTLLLAFPAAFLIHRIINRHKRIRFLLSMPYTASMMALSMIWLMFFNPQNGVVNKLMPLFGLNPVNWLETPGPAFLCVLTLVFWRSFCFTLFSCLQAMESQPSELYEFAALAGAGPLQTFLHIIIPQLTPTLLYVLPTASISVLTTFEPILLLTHAGMPPDMTTTLAYDYYRMSKLGQPGVACAIAVLLLVPILAGCFAFMRYVIRRKAVE